MSRSTAGVIPALVMMILGGAMLSSAHAAPPTVTPSPGYDARLQQSRKTMWSTFVTDPPSVRTHPPLVRRHHQVRAHRR